MEFVPFEQNELFHFKGDLFPFSHIKMLTRTCSKLQAALKDAKQSRDGEDEEIASLRSELEVKHSNLLCTDISCLIFPHYGNFWCGKYFGVYFSFAFITLFSFLNQNAKDGAGAVLDQLHGAKSELKALRSMTQRMVLTQKEMVCICILSRTLSVIIWRLMVNPYPHFRRKLFLRGVGLLAIGV